MEKLGVLISAFLNVNESAKEINSTQIAQLQAKLDKLKLKIDIDDKVLNSLSNFSKSIEKINLAYQESTKTVKQNITITEQLDGSIKKVVQDIQSNGSIIERTTTKIKEQSKEMQNQKTTIDSLAKAQEKLASTTLKLKNGETTSKTNVYKDIEKGITETVTIPTFGSDTYSTIKTDYEAVEKLSQKKMDLLHKEALEMNRIFNKNKADEERALRETQSIRMKLSKDKMSALHSEALEMNKYYDQQKRAETDLALYKQKMLGGNGYKGELEIFASKQKGKYDTDALKKIKADIEGLNTSTPELNTKIKQTGIEFSSLRQQAAESGNVMTRALENAGKFLRFYLVGGILVNTVNAFKGSIDYIRQFDDAVVDLTKVVDLSKTQIDAMKTSAISLGKELGKSSIDIMKGFAEFGRITKDVNEIQSLTRTATMASNVTDLTVENASKALTTAMIDFKINAKDSMQVLDQWNEIQNNFRTSAEDLAQSIGVVGAIATQSSTSIQDLEGYTTALVSSMGIQGSEAGTALKSMISRVFRLGSEGEEDAGKAEETLKGIGVAVRDTSGSFRAFSDIIKDTQSKFGGLNNVQQMAVAQAVGGTMHYGKFLGLMQNFNIAVDATTKAYNSQGSAIQENEKYINSISGRIAILGTTIQEKWNNLISSDSIKNIVTETTKLVDTFGNLKTVISLVGTGLLLWKGSDILKFFKNLPSDIKSGYTQMVAYQKALLSAKLAQQGMTATEIEAQIATKGLSLAFVGVGQSIKAAFLSNPLGWLAVGITTIISAIDMWNQKQDEIKQKQEEQVQKINQEISSLNDLKKQYLDIINSGDLTSESKQRLKSIQDQLIKTYGIEAENIDLVNGKYKDQIKVIDEISAKKYEDLKRSMGATGLEADRNLHENNTTEVKLDSFALFNPKAYKQGYLTASTEIDKVFTDLQKKYSDKFVLDDKNLLLGNSTFEINGTLADRVKILGELSDAVTNVASKDKSYEGIANDISNQFNTLNDKLKENTDIWNKYAEADFYTKYKEQISQVHELQNQLTQEKDTNKKSLIENQINSIKNSITTGKGYISDYKTFIDALFNAISDSSDKTADDFGNSSSKQVKSLSDMTKEVKSTVTSVKELNDIQADLSKGNKLTADSVIDLITQYPELIDYIHKTADGYTVEAQGMNIVRDALINKQMVALETESGITEAMKSALEARLNIYGIELESIKTLNDARNAAYKMNMTSDKQPDLSSLKQFASDVDMLGNISKLNTLKDLLTSGLKTGVKTPKTKTSPNRAELQEPEKLIEKDRYYQLNQELNKTEALLNKINLQEERAGRQEKIKLLDQEIKLLQRKQNNIHAIAEEERKERSELVKSLKTQGMKFSGTGDDITAANGQAILDKKLDAVNAHRNDKDRSTYNKLKSQYDDLKKSYDRFIELQLTDIPKAQEQWGELAVDIEKVKVDKISLSFEIFNDTLEPANRQLKELEHIYNLLGENDVAEKEKNINAQMKIKADMLNSINGKILEYQKLINSTKSTAEKEIYQNQIDSLKDQSYQLSEAITEATQKSNDDKLSLYNDSISKIKDLLKKQYDLDKELLDESLDNYKDYINGIIEERDRLNDSEDYQESINESNTKINEIQAEIDKRKMAAMQGDLVAINEIAELQKQKADEEKNLKDKQKDWERKQTKQNLQDNLKYYEDYTNGQKKLLDEKTSDTALQLEAERILAQNSITAVQDTINQLFNKTGENATKAGQLVQSELIAKLQQVMEIQKNLDSITALSSQSSSSNTNSNSSLSYVDRVKSQMRQNSDAYGTASPEQKKMLADKNLELGTSIGWHRDTHGVWYDQNGNLAQYATGGVDDKGGLSVLHGTPSAVETIFNAEQGKKLFNFVDNLPFSVNNILPNINLPQITPIASGAGNITVGDINIHGVSKIDESVLPNLTDRIMRELSKKQKLEFNRGGIYRSY